ncbi:hypothetical protein TNCV_1729861 [Trichonephila clavipes]|nr:hypothetical protein TNCV_1729861 [Trichonephila clavipes]
MGEKECPNVVDPTPIWKVTSESMCNHIKFHDLPTYTPRLQLFQNFNRRKENWRLNPYRRFKQGFGITFQDGDRFNSCQVIYSQFGLAIHQNDHQARRRFVEWSSKTRLPLFDFHKRILFSDEAHFWLNGYVNKQNCRIWSEANPQVYIETPLHPEKLTVWCALWAGGIIVSSKTMKATTLRVNGDRYRAMITNFFIPELNNHDVRAVVPTRRRNMSHSSYHNRFIERHVW